MAILLADKSYLKIDSNGNFIRYKNKTSRAKEKKLDNTVVLAKYQQLIDEFKITKDLVYYDYNKIIDYIQLVEESNRYVYDLEHGINTDEFPIISKYFSNIKDSIPVIIDAGRIGLPRKDMTNKEIYDFIKRCEIFGAINEIKDA